MNGHEREQRFGEIYLTMRDRLYRLCRGYLYEPAEAEDLFQEVMANIWHSLPRFRGEAGLGTWAYRVAVNTALLYNRQLIRRRPSWEPDMPVPVTPSPEDAASRTQLLDRLRRCISRLSGADRLLVSFLLEEMTYREMADILGISVNHVGVRINRVKRKLETCMRGNHGQHTD
ncbi:MAG: sigma-70 family RNA polymerase sigma factor [Acidobacteria bacterium]|nr:sigma-70 family RNA polymerase sigma factor [Acidobacteriota bacterium]